MIDHTKKTTKGCFDHENLPGDRDVKRWKDVVM